MAPGWPRSCRSSPLWLQSDFTGRAGADYRGQIWRRLHRPPRRFPRLWIGVLAMGTEVVTVSNRNPRLKLCSCGAKPQLYETKYGDWYVVCPVCSKAPIPTYFTRKDAIRAWNRQQVRWQNDRQWSGINMGGWQTNICLHYSNFVNKQRVEVAEWLLKNCMNGQRNKVKNFTKLSAFADTVKTRHQATNMFLMTNSDNCGFFMSEVAEWMIEL